jgi:uncharacterized protein (DUF362 family)
MNRVLIYKTNISTYPNNNNNYSPDLQYPEYPYLKSISEDKNPIYTTIRNCFVELGYDKENLGKVCWNPLGRFIKPGTTVLLKPNLVMHVNGIPQNGTDCLITHPSIIRAVADYSLIALRGTGKLIIGDAPLQSCDFDRLIKEQGLDKLVEFYLVNKVKTEIELCDFRNFKSQYKNGVLVEKENDSDNGVVVDLGSDSSFSTIPDERYKRLRVTNYPHDIMLHHHNPNKNEYIVAKQLLQADVIINLPKPKTHRYAGVTIAMKNLIGINTNKEALPHHSVGSLEDFGDEYSKKSARKHIASHVIDLRNKNMRNRRYISARLFSFLFKCISLVSPERKRFFGSWPGNDTIWRTIHDLNKIAFFTDKNGEFQDNSQRKMLIIGDMIVSGHESGPLSPTPKNVGVIVVGENPVCFDEAVCAYMGFDCSKIPTIANARSIIGKYNFSCKDEMVTISNELKLNNKKINDFKPDIVEHFAPNPAWSGWLS